MEHHRCVIIWLQVLFVDYERLKIFYCKMHIKLNILHLECLCLRLCQFFRLSNHYCVQTAWPDPFQSIFT